MSIIREFSDFSGETEHFSGKNGALRWSILVGKQKHNVKKPIISSGLSWTVKFQKQAPGHISKALFEGLIFGKAYIRREICVSKSIGLALWLEVNLPFLLCFTLSLRAIFQVQTPGGLYLERRFNGGFFALRVWGAYIWRGLYMEELIFGILR